MIDYMLFVPKMIERFSNQTLEKIEHGKASEIIDADLKGYAIIHKNIYYMICTEDELIKGGNNLKFIVQKNYTISGEVVESETVELNSGSDCVRRVRSLIGLGV